MVDDNLIVGKLYTSDELAAIFEFKPYYLRSAGGIVPVAAKKALLIITHPSDNASFEYGDYWDGEDLIYTGRGQSGDQILMGPNRDIAENRRSLYLFEHAGTYQRRYLGRTRCDGFVWGNAPDKNGNMRKVIRFRLTLDEKRKSNSAKAESLVRRLNLCLCGCGMEVSRAGNTFVQTHDGKLHGRIRRYLAGKVVKESITAEQLAWAYDKYPDLADIHDSDGTGIEYEEGAFREHRTRERSKSLVRAAKARFRALHGRLFCIVCDFDFARRYGGLGVGFIEAHHVRPISEMKPGETTHVEDLAMVCSNCHQMLHQGSSISIDELKLRLESERLNSRLPTSQARSPRQREVETSSTSKWL